MADIRIGISGWTYAPWRGLFYPEQLPQKKELAYASRQFNSIEINGTFYALQTPESFEKWYAATPKEFIFAVKGSRYITHMLRLIKCERALANFFASGLLKLNDKLGPILWQFPPTLKLNEERFEAFLKLLPRDLEEARDLALGHDKKVKGRIFTNITGNHPVRHAFEFRHESFRNKDFLAMLRNYGIATVFADSADKFPYMEDVTSDFIYIRLHGMGEMYVGGYDDRSIEYWAARIRLWAKGREPKDAARIMPAAKRVQKKNVFVYFDNDVKAQAPVDAKALMSKLGVVWNFPEELPGGKTRLESA